MAKNKELKEASNLTGAALTGKKMRKVRFLCGGKKATGQTVFQNSCDNTYSVWRLRVLW